jgi:serine/threonine protein kinase
MTIDEKRRECPSYDCLVRGEWESFWLDKPKVNPDLRDLLERMMCANYKNRITIAEIKNHPWFRANCRVDYARYELEMIINPDYFAS